MIRSSAKKVCPSCFGKINPGARKRCRHCYTWRPRSENGIYAMKLGISLRSLKLLGGKKRLAKLEPFFRNVLLKPFQTPQGIRLVAGGLEGRGYASRVPGMVQGPYARKAA